MCICMCMCVGFILVNFTLLPPLFFCALLYCCTYLSLHPTSYCIYHSTIHFYPHSCFEKNHFFFTPVNKKTHQQVNIKENTPVVTKIPANCLFTDSYTNNFQLNLLSCIAITTKLEACQLTCWLGVTSGKQYKCVTVRHAAVTGVFSNLTGSRIVTAYWLISD